MVKIGRLFLLLTFLVTIGISCSDSVSSDPGEENENGDSPPEVVNNSKKGFGITVREDNDWKSKVETLNVSWHYSWGGNLPLDHPQNVRFIPMVWGAFGDFSGIDETVNNVNAWAAQDKVDLLFGFNEPDASDQSNLSVDRAIEAWPKLMKADVPLVSPGPVRTHGEWMQEFMQRAEEKEYRIDYLAFHWYGGANPQALLNRLEEAYEMYGLPIWITEFAVADWDARTVEENRHSPEAVLTFMRDVLPKLDALEYIVGYAWFNSSTTRPQLTSSALFDLDGNLTTLGQYYANHK